MFKKIINFLIKLMFPVYYFFNMRVSFGKKINIFILILVFLFFFSLWFFFGVLSTKIIKDFGERIITLILVLSGMFGMAISIMAIFELLAKYYSKK